MDSTQLGALYERYGYFVRQRCLALLGNAADAEDATQEVFMRVQRYASSLKSPVTLAWLHAIAMRCCFDLMGRAKAHPVDPAQLAELGGPIDAEAADRQAVALQLLHRLDDSGREIAVLHHLEGWTQEEVAQRTGYSRKTIGKKLARFAEVVRVAWNRSALARGKP